MTIEATPNPVPPVEAPTPSASPEDFFEQAFLANLQGQGQQPPDGTSQTSPLVAEEPSVEAAQVDAPPPTSEQAPLEGVQDAPSAETPGAQRRIQELVSERNEFREAAQRQAEVIAQLQQSIAQQNAFQQQQWQAQQQQQQALAMQREQQRQIDLLRQQGIDFSDPITGPINALVFQTHQQMLETKAQMAAQLEEMRRYREQADNAAQEAQQQQLATAYMRGLESSFSAALKDYNVPAKTKQAVIEQAYDYAASAGISDPNVALQAVVDHIGLMDLLPKKTPVPGGAPKLDPALPPGALSMKGNGGGRRPGDPVSGPQQPTKGMDPEDALGLQFGIAANGFRRYG